MNVYAAAGDTWGVNGPTFLRVYIVVSAVVLIGAFLHRRRVFTGTSDPTYSTIQPQQAAYLNGGAKLAIYAALGALRTAGTIGSADGALTQTGRLATGATPLDQAIYNAAGNRLRPRDLAADTWVAEAVRQLRADLERAGLLVTVEQRRAARIGPLLLLGLVALGVLRLVAGMTHDRPVGYLVLTLVVLAGFTAVTLLRSTRRTRAGLTALVSMRRANRHLAPSEQPAWSLYGPMGAGMSVALFGTGAFWAADPAFAADAEVQQQYAAASGAGSSAYYGGGDSGGSSGGGGSCGGGSSCGGGGGGCGGGGCGG